MGEKSHYIATQAPLPQTIGDFWRMVWNHNVNVVLMLTGLVEGGINGVDAAATSGRCHYQAPGTSAASLPPAYLSPVAERAQIKAVQYWPDAGFRAAFDDGIVVENECEFLQDGLTMRALSLLKGGEAREVIHVSYETWPDFGTADYGKIAVLIEMVRSLRLQRFKASSLRSLPCPPTVIHCSAGVGRTGTFAAIDVLTQRLSQALSQALSLRSNCSSSALAAVQTSFESGLDVMGVVICLRRQRAGMVMTSAQYEMIYRYMDCALKAMVHWSTRSSPRRSAAPNYC